MRNLLKLALVVLFSNYIFALELLDDLTSKKIEKLVQKEEEIAQAYKKYIVKYGEAPTKIKDDLIDKGFLPKGFETINSFGTEIKIVKDNFLNIYESPHKVAGVGDVSTESTIFYNQYRYNEKREYTKAFVKNYSIPNDNYIEIVLSQKENIILKLKNKDKITTVKPSGTNTQDKFYLDEKGVLNYYKADGKLGYSFDKQIVLDKDIYIYNSNGNYNSSWHNGLNFTNDILKVGTSIFDSNSLESGSIEYVVVGPGKVTEVNKNSKNIGKTIIQFNRRAGGMIVNGDIYTWGNNGNAITGIDAKMSLDGKTSNGIYPLVTVPVPLRAKIYDTVNVSSSATPNNKLKYYIDDYYSSPKRPKFVDFFAGVYTGTCGVSLKGELYCGGTTGNQRDNNSTTQGDYTDVDKTSTGDGARKGELLYRSNHFDGSAADKKIKKVFANSHLWTFLGENGKVYIWGSNTSGFGALGGSQDKKLTNYQAIPDLNGIVDITYLTAFGFRRIGALSKSGEIYIWGVEDNNGSSTATTYGTCEKTWKDSNNKDIKYDMCASVKLTSENTVLQKNDPNDKSFPQFEYIRGATDAFIVRDINKVHYKLKQEKNIKIELSDLRTIIKTKWGYKQEDDDTIISADISSAISDFTTPAKASSGIVWINSKNELKGDIFTLETQNNQIFIDSIRAIKWKQIKVIGTDNGMCGIATNNQMYCWGFQSYYKDASGSSRNTVASTYIIPVFNTNLFDMNKDFMVTEAGDAYINEIANPKWYGSVKTDGRGTTKTDAFNIKYPTYIGGFNYEFEFK